MTNKQPDEVFDIRVVERLIAEGQITQADYDAFLAAIPDSADSLDQSHVQMIGHTRSRRVDSGAESEEEES